MRSILTSLFSIVLLSVASFSFATPSMAQESERRAPTDASRMTGTVNEIDASRRIIPNIKPLHFVFAGPEIGLTQNNVTSLKNLSLRLRNTADRVLITSFAGDNTTSTHDAVKLSLTRALIVRNFLENNGVLPDQIDLSALGQTKDNGDKNRVDITPALPE
jgi:outer membrane protein OmpA-like peptidoglycan-associated protein